MSNMIVNTNVLALNSHRAMKGVGTMQSKASARLSSGMKINSAADDAAGLAISEKMRAQIKGLDMASKNSQDAISLIQTAEGGMQEIDNMLQRIRELVVQASNDTNDQSTTTEVQGDRKKMQDEINQLIEEIDSMSTRVEFNKKKVISGDYGTGATAQVSGGTTPTDTTALDKAITDAFDAAEANSDYVAIDDINLLGSGTGSEGSDFKKAVADYKDAALSGTATADSIAALKKGIEDAAAAFDADSAGSGSEGADFLASAEFQALNEAVDALVADDGGSSTPSATRPNGTALHFQVGANSGQAIYLNIEGVDSTTLGLKDSAGNVAIDVMQLQGDAVSPLLDKMDAALTFVTTERSKLGAVQNRLEYTIKSLDISSENLSAAESRIRDTDMAKEMMNLTKANVLSQAATSMLAQANQAPQGVLQLLG